MRSLLVVATIAVLFLSAGCDPTIEPFSPAQIDQSVAPSEFPIAIRPELVGHYPGASKSGAGYFYDEVLEYRVWMDPDDGAARLAGDSAYFAAFARYENALAYSRSTKGAESPLVLVRQIESVNEPTPGVFEWDRVERVTEWKVQWLKGTKRLPTSIPEFLKSHRVSAKKT